MSRACLPSMSEHFLGRARKCLALNTPSSPWVYLYADLVGARCVVAHPECLGSSPTRPGSIFYFLVSSVFKILNFAHIF
jgi:hypothetical protein